jgi:UTP--glucose-1-phosphate uridylyltransferase
VLASLRASNDEDYTRYGYAGGREIAPGLLDAEVLVEKPGKEKAPSDFATVSGFLFTPDIFTYLDKVLESLPADSEFYYNDALKLMLQDGKRVLVKEITNGKFYDTGNKLEYLKTVVEFALKHHEVGDEFRGYLKGLEL